MATKCLVLRGLAKEVEEDLNKFLAQHDVQILHATQSSTGEYISLTVIYEEPSRVG
jgi:hypothetical protein